MPFPILPPRQREVLALLLQGHSEKQIARELGLSPHTVHAYIKSLHKTFNAASRGELLSICFRMLLAEAHRSASGSPVASVPRPKVELPAIEPMRIKPIEAVRRAVVGLRIKVPPSAAYSPGC